MLRSPFKSEDRQLRASFSTSKHSPSISSIIPIVKSIHLFKGLRGAHESLDESALGHGLKDILYVKCMQTIEELRIELEDEKRARVHSDENYIRLERDLLEKDSIIRELTYRADKITGKTPKD